MRYATRHVLFCLLICSSVLAAQNNPSQAPPPTTPPPNKVQQPQPPGTPAANKPAVNKTTAAKPAQGGTQQQNQQQPKQQPGNPPQTPTQPNAAKDLLTPKGPVISPAPDLPATVRGTTVTVKLTPDSGPLPAQGVKVVLRTGNEDPKKGEPDKLDATVASDGKSLTFQIPKDHIASGRYLVYVAYDATELPVPGDLRVVDDNQLKVKVDSIWPGTDYASNSEKAKNGDSLYDLVISGENLAPTPNDNGIEVVGQGLLTAGSAEECRNYANTGIYDKICLSYDLGMETRKLNVKGFHPAHYEGPVVFRVHVGDNVSDAQRVTFSNIDESNLRLLATAVSLLIALIILGIVWKGVSLYRQGEDYGVVSFFFLDKETNSYSLSKFQLVAWTAVAVFAYVYIFFCRTLIQWDFTFPPIPNGWPTLLGVSAGTTVAAVGITSTRGSKGAGPPKPTFADFISSGGLVAGDRFQFFVWTLVGCAGFLLLVLSSDPSLLKNLPDVPEGFLLLMGISATGYLGGKVVRVPGPVIKQLLVSTVTPPVKDNNGNITTSATIIINLKGENLSTKAGVKINDDELRPDQFSIDDGKPQDAPADPTFRSELNVTLKKADAYLEGQRNITLINKDGQMATANFPVDPLTIDKGQVFPAGTTEVPVTVKGANFETEMQAEWTAQGSTTPTPITQDKLQRKSDKEVVVNLIPGPAGTGKLTLTSKIGLRASADVTVK
jgi:hypothetical protein